MNRIAVAAEGTDVSSHFGRCPTFRVYDVTGGTIGSVQDVANPGHEAGSPPDHLAALGATVAIVGGIGAGAIERLRGHGIEVIAGADGSADEAVDRYLAGLLQDSGAGCGGHGHSHDADHACTCGH